MDITDGGAKRAPGKKSIPRSFRKCASKKDVKPNPVPPALIARVSKPLKVAKNVASTFISKVNGRKRHIIVDTVGLLWRVVVHRANIQDATSSKDTLPSLFDQIKPSVHNRWCRLKLVWADGAYASFSEWLKKNLGWKLEIKKRPLDAQGFVVLPRRWVVERTFGWLGHYRRLSRDFEHTVSSSESMVYAASVRRMLRLQTTQT
jgi:transposase